MTNTRELLKAQVDSPKTVKIAYRDKMMRNSVFSFLLFYKKSIQPELLKKSLSDILIDFDIFTGRLVEQDDELYFNCNNKGLVFAAAGLDNTLEGVINQLDRAKTDTFIDVIDRKKVIKKQLPLCTFKVTYLSDGSMIIGVSWHHVIGDMATILVLMRAWACKASEKEYEKPLIVPNRQEFLTEKIPPDGDPHPTVRYLDGKNLLKLIFYFMNPFSKTVPVSIYFTPGELEQLKSTYINKTGQKLSTNDTLCAHIMSSITRLDKSYKKDRNMVILVNLRNKVDLSPVSLGNFVDGFVVSGNSSSDPYTMAREIREKNNNFLEKISSYHATLDYIESIGGDKSIKRCLPVSFDVIKRTLCVTNYCNFDIYDLSFSGEKPYFFTVFNKKNPPWLVYMNEGFSNKGRVATISLPRKLAKQFCASENLKEVHRFRGADQVPAGEISRIPWLV